MATSVVPALLDALFAGMTTALPNVTVLDGNGISGNPGDFLMVGLQDLEAEIPTAATATEEQMAYGTTRPRKEEGTVFLTAFSWNGISGDAGQKAARDAVYAIAAAVATFVRVPAQPDALGVTGLLGVRFGSTTTFRQGQSDMGAGAELMFGVEYVAQI